jgi:hypothetical protein
LAIALTSTSAAIGCRGLLVHAESEQARGFYEHLIPEFERSPTESFEPEHWSGSIPPTSTIRQQTAAMNRSVDWLHQAQFSFSSPPSGAIRPIAAPVAAHAAIHQATALTRHRRIAVSPLPFMALGFREKRAGGPCRYAVRARKQPEQHLLPDLRAAQS